MHCFSSALDFRLSLFFDPFAFQFIASHLQAFHQLPSLPDVVENGEPSHHQGDPGEQGDDSVAEVLDDALNRLEWQGGNREQII